MIRLKDSDNIILLTKSKHIFIHYLNKITIIEFGVEIHYIQDMGIILNCMIFNLYTINLQLMSPFTQILIKVQIKQVGE